MKRAAAQELKGILATTDAAASSRSTSTTIRIPRRSTSTRPRCMDGTLVRVLSWYDNEWGFSNRMADTAVAMAKLI